MIFSSAPVTTEPEPPWFPTLKISLY
jgi:hypothetical protein